MSNLLDRASILVTPTAVSNSTLHSVKPVQAFGSELVTNGDFATNSNWNVNAGWSISDGKANVDTDNGTLNFTQSSVLVVGKKYRLSLNANLSAGNIKFESGEGDNFVFDSDVDSHIFTADSTLVVFRRNTTPTRGYIDNVSVVEVTDGDFNLTRATTATRVNSSGLIESVASGLPRIDFLGGTGQVLLEPASTNTATYSNDFTQGDIFSGSSNPSLSNAVLTANQGTAPDGTNTAFLLKDNNDGSTGSSNLNYFNTAVVSDNFNTFSVFAKKSLSSDILMELGGYDDGFPTAAFDLETGTLGFVNSNITAKIEDYGNDWYRCQATSQTTTDVQGFARIGLKQSSSEGGSSLITRDGTNGVLLFGLQAEADASRNFATSYIPTSGSTVTRNKDEANSSGDTSLINSTEGVLYAEIAALADDSVARNISLGNGVNLHNTVEIYYDTGSQSIRFRVRANNSLIVNSGTSLTDRTQFTKVAVKYKSGDIVGFINGVQVLSATDSFTFSDSLSKLAFDRGNGGNEFEGKVKCVAVFKEFLNNDELECLTGSGFDSFTALAEAGSYTII